MLYILFVWFLFFLDLSSSDFVEKKAILNGDIDNFYVYDGNIVYNFGQSSPIYYYNFLSNKTVTLTSYSYHDFIYQDDLLLVVAYNYFTPYLYVVNMTTGDIKFNYYFSTCEISPIFDFYYDGLLGYVLISDCNTRLLSFNQSYYQISDYNITTMNLIYLTKYNGIYHIFLNNNTHVFDLTSNDHEIFYITAVTESNPGYVIKNQDKTSDVILYKDDRNLYMLNFTSHILENYTLNESNYGESIRYKNVVTYLYAESIYAEENLYVFNLNSKYLLNLSANYLELNSICNYNINEYGLFVSDCYNIFQIISYNKTIYLTNCTIPTSLVDYYLPKLADCNANHIKSFNVCSSDINVLYDVQYIPYCNFCNFQEVDNNYCFSDVNCNDLQYCVVDQYDNYCQNSYNITNLCCFPTKTTYCSLSDICFYNTYYINNPSSSTTTQITTTQMTTTQMTTTAKLTTSTLITSEITTNQVNGFHLLTASPTFVISCIIIIALINMLLI